MLRTSARPMREVDAQGVLTRSTTCRGDDATGCASYPDGNVELDCQSLYLDLELWRFDHICESSMNSPVKNSTAEMVQSIDVIGRGYSISPLQPAIGIQDRAIGTNHDANLNAMLTNLSSPIARTIASSSSSVMDRCEVDQCSTGCCGGGAALRSDGSSAARKR